MPSDHELRRLALRVGRRLLAKRRRVVTAESCTGGWISKALTDIPGSSQWFEMAFVTYSNAAKTRYLGVRAQTLVRHGAVSGEVAREMARGALRASDAELAVAVTGIAGPDGGSPSKPVGTVWFCWAERQGRRQRLRTRKVRFSGDRRAVRASAVALALRGLIAR
jgi:nicotinamide-nucleotide amidase